ncbi:MAG: dinitrogenase iron-molybdenum cofactor biosynthesis protein [Candidatus Buchananbacteria bacterium]|nr:dinitrogenase iron-molybdenum cofactor biosynthesis protein [Candidatus Buchananbacteria bacterium]
MKIAIPTNGKNLDDLVATHFGRAKNFLIYNTENKNFKIIQNTSQHMGGQGIPPELLKQHNINTVICNSLGFKAVQNLTESAIEIYCGANNSIKQALIDFFNKQLTKATKDNSCNH